MKSNICYMLDEAGREDMLDAVEQTAKACDLTKKEQLQLRLTAEELMCFLFQLPGEYEASFWLEQKKDRFEIHLTVALLMGKENLKKVLKSAEQTIQDEVNGLVTALSEFFVANTAQYVWTKLLHRKEREVQMDAAMKDSCYIGLGVTNWSLERYQREIFQNGTEIKKQELAHSILASLSDELYLSIQQNRAEIIAVRQMRKTIENPNEIGGYDDARR